MFYFTFFMFCYFFLFSSYLVFFLFLFGFLQSSFGETLVHILVILFHYCIDVYVFAKIFATCVGHFICLAYDS